MRGFDWWISRIHQLTAADCQHLQHPEYVLNHTSSGDNEGMVTFKDSANVLYDSSQAPVFLSISFDRMVSFLAVASILCCAALACAMSLLTSTVNDFPSCTQINRHKIGQMMSKSHAHLVSMELDFFLLLLDPPLDGNLVCIVEFQDLLHPFSCCHLTFSKNRRNS